MQIVKQQIKTIHTLLGAYAKHRGYLIEPEEKKQFVQECSNGRVSSTTQLTYQEAQQLIASLNNLMQRTTDWQKADRQRKLMIHYARQMGWETPAGKADMKRIDDWCCKTGYLHKPLMRHNEGELARLVQQFQKMYLAFLKSF